MSSPVIGITMGDPAGIGPEIIVRVLARKEVFAFCRPLIFGDPHVLGEANKVLGFPCIINPVTDPKETKGCPGIADLIELSHIDLKGFRFGVPRKSYATPTIHYLETALSFAQDEKIDAITTCPVNKGFLNDAGHPFSGHTEFLAQRTDSGPVVMMLVTNALRVALVTTHHALRDVAALITPKRIIDTIRITYHALRVFFEIRNPKLAVSALNPHAGEGGLFGCEEQTIILPAVNECRKAGINIEGPLPSDSLFHFAAKGKYDAIVCMYHDQGLIPIKLTEFKKAVNVTLGLPIIRTSVDHGTAYEIAGRGEADPSSLFEAIILAGKMARVRGKGLDKSA